MAWCIAVLAAGGASASATAQTQGWPGPPGSVPAVFVAGFVVALAFAAALLSLMRARRRHRVRDRSGRDAIWGARNEINKRFQGQRESRARLLQSMAAAGFGAWSVDLQTGRSWRSPQYDRIFGYATPLPSWSLGMFLGHVVEQDREQVEAALQHAHAAAGDVGAMSVTFECRIRRADGAIVWIEAQGRRESEGESGSTLFGLVHDITPRKQAEALLQESEARIGATARQRARQVPFVGAQVPGRMGSG